MDSFVMIKDMRSGMKNINVVFIVLEVGHPTTTKENREVRTLKVADQSACINASIWDEPGQLLMPGDICKLTKGYLSHFRNCLTLFTTKNGDLQKVGEFCMLFNEHLNMSEQSLAMPMSAPILAPPNNSLLNNGTNNGAGRVNPPPLPVMQAPASAAIVNNSSGVPKQLAAQSANRLNSSTTSTQAVSSSNSSDNKGRMRGNRGGHRNRHSRS